MVLPNLEYALPVWYTPIHEDPNTRRQTGSIGHTNIMDKIQRLGCKLITGAYRSTATDVLELHAWIPPIQIRLDDICYCEALRLVTLLSSHPLYKAVQCSSRRRPRSHPSAIHNLLQRYKICPDNIETIDSTRHHPSWHAQFTAHIASSKLVAASTLRTRVDNIQINSDGSGYKGNIGAVAVTPQDRQALRYRLGKESKHTVFEGEITGVILALSLLEAHPAAKSALITLDNQAVIQALQNNRTQPAQHLLDYVYTLIRWLKQKCCNLHIHLEWVPGHMEIGN